MCISLIMINSLGQEMLIDFFIGDMFLEPQGSLNIFGVLPAWLVVGLSVFCLV